MSVEVLDPGQLVRSAAERGLVAFRQPGEPRVAVVEGTQDDVVRYLCDELGLDPSEAHLYVDVHEG